MKARNFKPNVCRYCGEMIESKDVNASSQRYHKRCSIKVTRDALSKKWRTDPEFRRKGIEASAKNYKKRNLEYVKVPMLINYNLQSKNEFHTMPPKNKKLVSHELIYCDGMSQDIQKMVPKMMDEIALKLLYEDENTEAMWGYLFNEK